MSDWEKKPLLRTSEEGYRPVRLNILGDFVLSDADGCHFPIATKKNRALLAVLALSPGFQATRERLCGLLWGDRGEDQARSSLRQSLAVLRKELGGAEGLVLKTHDDIVALRRDTAQVDAIDFLALSNDSGITTLRQAAKLYRGELLGDTSIRDAAFEDWLSAERSRLKTVAIKIFDRLIPLEEGHSRIVAAQQLVSFDPLRESSHRLLMQAYADQGDNGLALKQFELCRKLLHEELSVEPARETLELKRQIAEGDRKSIAQKNAQPEPSLAIRLEHLPSIAVLPFADLSGNPQHDYFADGITEDIITELSRFKSLFVIARNSAFSFKAKSIAIATIANELGVRFLLEGSVRRSGDRIRVTARLVDAEAGGEAWAERYDRVIEDIFAVQDDVVRTIVATLEGQLASTVASQSRRQTPSNILAYEYVLQARKFLDIYDAQSAEPLLRRAIAADGRYAQAHAWMAMVYWVKFFQDHQDREITEAVAFGKTAVALDPGDSVCHMQLGFAYIFARKLELADIHSLKALELNPADMLALGLRAQLLCRLGRSQEAIETLDQLVRHDPFPPNWYWENRSIVLLTLDRFEDALAAIQHMPELFWWNHGYVAICCARLGRIKEAQDAIKHALELRPELTIQRFMMGEPYKLPEDANRMIEGLRMAGLPEHVNITKAKADQ